MIDFRTWNTALTWMVGAVFFVGCTTSETVPWRESSASWGLEHIHQSGAAGQHRLPEIMGGGVALFDADGDGDLDLFLTGGVAADALWINEGNQLRQASFPGDDTRTSVGATAGDCDNDGDVDLLVTQTDGVRLYLNDGEGQFTDATAVSGLDLQGWATSAAFADFNADGWLDLFVVRYVREHADESCTDAAGRQDYCSPAVFTPETDSLWLNLGDGRFEDASRPLGFERAVGAGLGVVTLDANDDGRADLFVANDGDPNHLWIQQPDGTFQEEALLRGAAYNRAGEPEAGMGVVAADFENRGTLDLFLTHLAEESHTLYRALDDGRFRDISHDRALAQSSFPYTGFGAAAFDEEGDGDLDLWVANGRVSGGFGAEGNRFAEANQRFVQTAKGGFETVSFGRAEISRGLAAGDLDGDGDEDVVIAQIDSATDLWINDHPSVKRLIIEAWLPDQQRHAIGAEIHLIGENEARVARIDRSGSYLSAKPPYASFGLPSAAPSAIDVRWPDGSWERFPVDPVERRLRLERGSGEAR